jgi:Primase C terminal 1 (PriCT-1)/Protein of unknown function (DUF3987)
MGLVIKEAKQWLLWNLDRGRKRCYNRWGEPCGSTDEVLYVDFATAEEAAQIHGMQGAAFCFRADDPWIGIDLDDCLIDYRTPKEWAIPILERFRDTYCEVSPSLKGVKIYAEGCKPHSRSCVSLEDGAIEVYDRGRFFAFTGVRLRGYGSDQIADCQEAIDWLYETYFAPASAQMPVVTLTVPCSGSLESRAAAYLAAADRPLPGSRNRTCFSLAGHLAAMIGSDGELLTEDRIFALLLSWNELLSQPLDQSEVRRTVRSAMTSGTPREPKPAEARTVEIAQWMLDLDKHKRTESGLKTESAQVEIEEPPFPAHLLEVPGFLGEVVQYARQTCFWDQPILFLSAAIALQAVLCGRKVFERFGNRPHLYCLALSESGTGKEHARTVVNRILNCIEAWSALGNLETPRSGSGIARALEQHPAKLSLIDEFGRFMRFQRSVNVSGHISEIGDVWLKLYSAGEGKWSAAQHSDSKLNLEIERPSYSIYATSVPGNLWEAMTIDQITDGLLGRFLVFSGEARPEVGPREPNLAVPESILDHASRWFHWPGGDLSALQVNGAEERLVPHTPAAHARMVAIFEAAVDREGVRSPEERALLARVPQNTCRLALVYACSQSVEAPQIDCDAVEWAHGIASYCAAWIASAATQRIAESDFHRRQNRVVDWLASKPECTMTEFTKKWQNWPKKQRDELLQNLMDTERIQLEKEAANGAGRPQYRIRLLRR